jgi:hypothetical protein
MPEGRRIEQYFNCLSNKSNVPMKGNPLIKGKTEYCFEGQGIGN